jgi:hypothetical protein
LIKEGAESKKVGVWLLRSRYWILTVRKDLQNGSQRWIS